MLAGLPSVGIILALVVAYSMFTHLVPEEPVSPKDHPLRDQIAFGGKVLVKPAAAQPEDHLGKTRRGVPAGPAATKAAPKRPPPAKANANANANAKAKAKANAMQCNASNVLYVLKCM